MKCNVPITGRAVDYPADANILSTTDLDSVITYANDDFVRISGFSRDELLGQPHHVVRHPDMPARAFEQMWRALKSGRSWMGLVKNRCRNGDHYWVSAFVTPISSAGSTVEYQSVRTRPTDEQIAAAEQCYARLRNGRQRWWERLPVPGLQARLSLSMAMVLALVMGVGQGWTSLRWYEALFQWTAAIALASLATWALLRPFERLCSQARALANNPLSQ